MNAINEKKNAIVTLSILKILNVSFLIPIIIIKRFPHYKSKDIEFYVSFCNYLYIKTIHGI